MRPSLLHRRGLPGWSHRWTHSPQAAAPGEVLTGRRPGRTSTDAIPVFDSTGCGVQDAAAAARVYGRAVAAGQGMRLPFSRFEWRRRAPAAPEPQV